MKQLYYAYQRYRKQENLRLRTFASSRRTFESLQNFPHSNTGPALRHVSLVSLWPTYTHWHEALQQPCVSAWAERILYLAHKTFISVGAFSVFKWECVRDFLVSILFTRRMSVWRSDGSLNVCFTFWNFLISDSLNVCVSVNKYKVTI